MFWELFWTAERASMSIVVAGSGTMHAAPTSSYKSSGTPIAAPIAAVWVEGNYIFDFEHTDHSRWEERWRRRSSLDVREMNYRHRVRTNHE